MLVTPRTEMGREMRERPVPSIWLSEATGPGNNARTTDAEGRWTLGNVPAGDQVEVSVKLTHPNYISDTAWGSLQHEQAVTMQSLRDGTAKIVMHDGPVVTGTVTDPDGRPVAGAVVVWGDDPYLQTGSQEVQTGADGAYRFPPLNPGPTTLTVVAQGWKPELTTVDIQPELPPVNFELQPGRTLRIRFVDSSGEAIANVGVGVRRWRGKESLYNHRHPNVLDTRIPVATDNRGVYEWSWAPADEVEYSFGKEGFRSLTRTFIAGEKEHVVTLQAE